VCGGRWSGSVWRVDWSVGGQGGVWRVDRLAGRWSRSVVEVVCGGRWSKSVIPQQSTWAYLAWCTCATPPRIAPTQAAHAPATPSCCLAAGLGSITDEGLAGLMRAHQPTPPTGSPSHVLTSYASWREGGGAPPSTVGIFPLMGLDQLRQKVLAFCAPVWPVLVLPRLATRSASSTPLLMLTLMLMPARKSPLQKLTHPHACTQQAAPLELLAVTSAVAAQFPLWQVGVQLHFHPGT